MKNHYKCSHLFALNTSSRVPFVLLPQICNFAMRRNKHFIGLICCLGLLLWLFVMYYSEHFLEFLHYPSVRLLSFARQRWCIFRCDDDRRITEASRQSSSQPSCTNAFTAKAKRRANTVQTQPFNALNRLTDLSRGCANIYVTQHAPCTQKHTLTKNSHKSASHCARWNMQQRTYAIVKRFDFELLYAFWPCCCCAGEGSFAISFRRACACSMTKYHGQ